MTISQKAIRMAAQKAFRGERSDYDGIPPKLKAILQRGFTAEQINDVYRKVRQKGARVGTAKV